jgi:ribosome modulation factor
MVFDQLERLKNGLLGEIKECPFSVPNESREWLERQSILEWRVES